jgi:hypothetical protein
MQSLIHFGDHLIDYCFEVMGTLGLASLNIIG